VHCTTQVPQGDGWPIYDATLHKLQHVCRQLSGVKVRFAQTLRTWFYLGGIVDGDGPYQRYAEFNRARSDFFHSIRFGPGTPNKNLVRPAYPASTGIGVAGRGVMMSAISVATDRSDVCAVPLENPRQMAAYDYSEDCSPDRPKFSRAMALSCGTTATIFISGTASIIHQQTRHAGNIARQTAEALDNIAALIDEENFARSGLPGLGSSLASLALARVYVKRPGDYAQVRDICDRRLGDVPTVYAVADICRKDLLVEIEGVAFSRPASEGSCR
jgi:enamine deaminase RidA (YjgF/YER057c/UK114 family)